MASSTLREEQLRFLDETNAAQILQPNPETVEVAIREKKASELFEEMYGEDAIDTEMLETGLAALSVFLNGGGNSTTQQAFEGFGTSIAGQLDVLAAYARQSAEDAEKILGLKGRLKSPRAPLQGSAKLNKHELDKATGGAVNVAGLRPPNVVNQILAKTDPGVRAEFSRILNIEKPKFLDTIGACAILSLLGFGRDKGIRKLDGNRALEAAKRENKDSSHIAYSLHCAAFVTADKRAARKAYALAELYKISCLILFMNSSGKLSEVSESNWP